MPEEYEGKYETPKYETPQAIPPKIDQFAHIFRGSTKEQQNRFTHFSKGLYELTVEAQKGYARSVVFNGGDGQSQDSNLYVLHRLEETVRDFEADLRTKSLIAYSRREADKERTEELLSVIKKALTQDE